MTKRKTETVWEQATLFPDNNGIVDSPPELKGMVRKRDHITSVAAARTVKEIASKTKQQIIMALRLHGPMTDGELEMLPQFADLGPSTVRKRRCELEQMKKPMVRWKSGEKRPHPKTGSMMKVWEYCGPK